MTWPTRIEHGREVIDGSQLPDGATLRVRLGSAQLWCRYHIPAHELDGQPVDAVRDIGLQMAVDLLQVEVTR